MSKSEKIIFSILSLIAGVMAGGLIIMFATKWKQPLGPTLQNFVTAPLEYATVGAQSLENNAPLSAPQAVSVTRVPTSTDTVSEPRNSCGGQSPMFILLIGSDTRANGYLYGLADVIRIARIDFDKPEVVILEFPRDLWVEIPDIADNLSGQDHEKLNQAYLYGNKGFGYSNDPAGGPGLLSRTLTLNFGTQIDQYVAVNMRTFEDVVDAVGGIDITLPKTVDGRTDEDRGKRLLFTAGIHHLNGEQALTLARIRINGVFNRAENQSRVICALRNKIMRPDIIPYIPDLVKSFQNSIQTSLSPEQISQLACLGSQLEPKSIILTSFPQELFEQDRIYDPAFKKEVFIWNVDAQELKKYTDLFNKGEWPSPVAAIGSNQPPAPSTDPNPKTEALFCE